MEKREIGYIGFSEKMIRLLLDSPDFRLVIVIWGDGRHIDLALVRDLEQRGVVFCVGCETGEVVRHMNASGCRRYVMYQCEFILPSEILKKAEVFNFHPGSLKTNRGAHPIIWTILLGESETCMSLHKINEKIDHGILIRELWIQVALNDDSLSLEHKLEDKIPELLRALTLYLEGKLAGTAAETGQYRRKIREQDYTIQADVDTMETISAKIRSQAKYKGAVLLEGDKKFYVTDVRAAQ